jgi:hypothetical protein
VDADVDGAVYDRSTSDPTRIWARPMTRREYELSWWLGSGDAWSDAQIPIKRAFAQMEPYSTLRLPYGVASVRNVGATPATMTCETPGIHIVGKGRGSAIVWSGDIGNGTNGTTMFLLRADDQRIENFRISGMRTAVSQGGANAVLWTKTSSQDAIGRSTVPLRGFKALDMFFDNMSHPIATLGNVLTGPGDENAPIVPCQDVEIAGCDMEFDYFS